MTTRRFVVRACAALGLAALTLTGCAQPGNSSNAAPPAGGVGGLGAVSTRPTLSPTAAAPTTGAPAHPSPSPKTTGSHPSPSPTGPRIAYFKVVGKANCGESGPGFSSQGTVTLEWQVYSADSVTLSIDGPGAYQTGYGLHGTDTLPFACGNAVGETTSHTYTVSTVGGGPTRTKTITVSAINHG